MTETTIMAMLYGMMLGDGWLSNSNGRLIGGFSGDVHSLEEVKNDLHAIGLNIGKATIVSKKTYSPKYGIKGVSSYFVITHSACEVFLNAGITTGKKVEVEFLLPNWIMSGSKEVKAAFLSGLYSAEGYTPAMQKNDKTAKTLGFNITKRYALKDNFHEFLNQITSLLNDLDIQHSIVLKETFTCDKNLKAIVTFDNNIDNIIQVTSILDLKYCVDKKIAFDSIRRYHEAKRDLLCKLTQAQKESLNRDITAQAIADKYGVLRSQVENWRRPERKDMRIRIPNDFPTYTQFMQQSCHTINSVN